MQETHHRMDPEKEKENEMSSERYSKLLSKEMRTRQRLLELEKRSPEMQEAHRKLEIEMEMAPPGNVEPPKRQLELETRSLQMQETTGSASAAAPKTTSGSASAAAPKTSGSASAAAPKTTSGSATTAAPKTTGSASAVAPKTTSGSASAAAPKTSGSASAAASKTTGSASAAAPKTTSGSASAAAPKTCGSASAAAPKTTSGSASAAALERSGSATSSTGATINTTIGPTIVPTIDMGRPDATQPDRPSSSNVNVQERRLTVLRRYFLYWIRRCRFLIILLAGFVVATLALYFYKPLHVCRCGSAEDTFRSRQDFSINNNISRKELRYGNDHSKPTFKSTKILGFVGVLTSFSSVDRRAALRSSWFPSNPDDLRSLEQATGLVLRFVIGRSKDAKKMADLNKEIKRYSDFLLIDVEEEYVNLSNKTLASFKAAYDHFEADYYVKANDNIYLRPDRLAVLLAKKRTDPMTYIGCMKRGPVTSGLGMTKSEKSGHVIGYEDFIYAYGSIYVLSEEIVAKLAVARNTSFRMFSNEDISVGTWMLAMNVNQENNQALCDPKCTPTTIAVWDIPRCSDGPSKIPSHKKTYSKSEEPKILQDGLCNPVDELKELHKSSMCSKSPTRPSD